MEELVKMTRGYHSWQVQKWKKWSAVPFPNSRAGRQRFFPGGGGGWRDRQFIRIESSVNLLRGLTLYGTDYGEVYA